MFRSEFLVVGVVLLMLIVTSSCSNYQFPLEVNYSKKTSISEGIEITLTALTDVFAYSVRIFSTQLEGVDEKRTTTERLREGESRSLKFWVTTPATYSFQVTAVTSSGKEYQRTFLDAIEVTE